MENVKKNQFKAFSNHFTKLFYSKKGFVIIEELTEKRVFNWPGVRFQSEEIYFQNSQNTILI